MKHIIALLVENEAGALSGVVGLSSARGYNIESLTVATTEDPAERLTYESDALVHLRATPGAVVLPASAAEVQAVVRLCQRLAHVHRAQARPSRETGIGQFLASRARVQPPNPSLNLTQRGRLRRGFLMLHLLPLWSG